MQTLGVSDENDNCAGFPKEAENLEGAEPVCVVNPGNKAGREAPVDKALKDIPRKKAADSGVVFNGAGSVLVSFFLAMLL